MIFLLIIHIKLIQANLLLTVSKPSIFYTLVQSNHIDILKSIYNFGIINEPPHEKTNNLHMRKQRRRNREADHRLCFRCTDSTITLLSKSKISSFYQSPVLVQPGLCPTCLETTLLVFPRGSSNGW